MTKTMLIDAANPEEVRVCVLQNGKVEDFDFESATRKPLRGNIYLARVTRVEPSLQAAFVEFGGNRHGFLAFSEIHPDYYQIPVSDRQKLQEAEAEEAALAEALNLKARDEDDEAALDDIEDALESDASDGPPRRSNSRVEDDHGERGDQEPTAEISAAEAASPLPETSDEFTSPAEGEDGTLEQDAPEEAAEPAASGDDGDEFLDDAPALEAMDGEAHEAGTPVDEVGGAAPGALEDDDQAEEEDESDEEGEDSAPSRDNPYASIPRGELIERYKDARRKRARLLRSYKIQEVVKRRQIMLVQAVKEERGNKGAALTTYLSLAGRYCVLMPNTSRGGGISRKIPVAADRKRLRRVVDSLNVPGGMGLIIRTAGAKRTKAEIKRDYEYLARLWDNIKTLTLKSIAPCLIYEEASLIKRAIRDLYDKDIGQILVDGDGGYREAKDFMKMLMPSHSKNVQPYKDTAPLFLRYNVESQLDAMYQPTVRLKSGGYIVINQTEALIAIDVNSGKSTRERNIEQTALRTNLEAADEAARQCRLRDLAGLIVIDFIDMEEMRNNRAVEKRLKDALRFDRARIQVGRISTFGLLELSRQRRRSGIVDGTTHACPTCGGAGAVRSHEMAALRILRAAEHEANSGKAGFLQIKAALDVALYILNHKREWLSRIETSYGVRVEMIADPAKAGDNFEVEKTGVKREVEEAPTEIVRADMTETILPDNDDAIAPAAADPDEEETGETPDERRAHADEGGEERGGRRRRRRRGRRGRREDDEQRNADSPRLTGEPPLAHAGDDDLDQPVEIRETEDGAEKRFETNGERGEDGSEGGRNRRRRRRGRRGGRRNGRERPEAGAEETGDPADAHGIVASGEVASDDFDVAEKYSEEAHAAPQADDRPPVAWRPEPAATSELAPDPVAPDLAAAERPPARRPAMPAPEPAPDEAAVAPPQPPRKGWWSRAFGG
jgi:ribonuclease E